ncbi:MAG: DUF4387 domain-containing protein [Desulfitobacteriaceae bacterium]|nr:DUF4387 domain-containing protein [Desulfitobacteriaceae bacterium]MDD4345902.1 DUF4387 domain-containing protein [Desulfitobacteriaceae bacterium]MDD4402108.1 DUF4387 domain-containing protein [Desulfitobacteriaceae bacterium]
MSAVNRPIRELADVIRSKNAGPHELTLDIIFKTREIFQQVIASRAITPQRIAALYSMPPEKVISFVEFAPAKAIKITLVRPWICGDVGDNDIYGAQQHAPLLMLELPLSGE